jgi:hypothetical protein
MTIMFLDLAMAGKVGQQTRSNLSLENSEAPCPTQSESSHFVPEYFFKVHLPRKNTLPTWIKPQA